MRTEFARCTPSGNCHLKKGLRAVSVRYDVVRKGCREVALSFFTPPMLAHIGHESTATQLRF